MESLEITQKSEEVYTKERIALAIFEAIYGKDISSKMFRNPKEKPTTFFILKDRISTALRSLKNSNPDLTFMISKEGNHSVYNRQLTVYLLEYLFDREKAYVFNLDQIEVVNQEIIIKVMRILFGDSFLQEEI